MKKLLLLMLLILLSVSSYSQSLTLKCFGTSQYKTGDEESLKPQFVEDIKIIINNSFVTFGYDVPYTFMLTNIGEINLDVVSTTMYEVTNADSYLISISKIDMVTYYLFIVKIYYPDGDILAFHCLPN